MNQQHDRNATTDLERRLAGLLREDGGRAPERAIDGAVAYARAHPRRRDVLDALRPDPMDGYGSVPGVGRLGAGGGLPRVATIVALGLLFLAAFTVASVGGLFEGRPVVVPPDASPSSGPTLVPTGPAPSPTLPPVATIRVDLDEVVGADAFIEITDESLTLFQAVSGTPLDGGSTDGSTVVVSQPDSVSRANRITLTWTGTPCDTGHQLLIEPDGRTMRMFRTACEGDAIPRDLVLVLTFDAPVDPADVSITLETVIQ